MNAWMPLYIGDYLGDTMHLTRDQHGGYMLLIMAYWRTGKPLPDNDNLLSAIVKSEISEWRQGLREALAPFFTIADGLWHHKRVDAELMFAANMSNKRAIAGRMGASKRWENKKKGRNGKGTVLPMANRWQTDGNHNHNKKEKVEAKASTKEKADTLKAEFAQWYAAYPHKVGPAAAEQKFAIARKLASLAELLDGVRRYKATKPPTHAWCNPATWLHQRRWQDQPDTSPERLNGQQLAQTARSGPIDALHEGAARAAAAVILRDRAHAGSDQRADIPPSEPLLDFERDGDIAAVPNGGLAGGFARVPARRDC